MTALLPTIIGISAWMAHQRKRNMETQTGHDNNSPNSVHWHPVTKIKRVNPEKLEKIEKREEQKLGKIEKLDPYQPLQPPSSSSPQSPPPSHQQQRISSPQQRTSSPNKQFHPPSSPTSPTSDQVPFPNVNHNPFSTIEHSVFLFCLDFLDATETAKCLEINKHWQDLHSNSKLWELPWKNIEKTEKMGKKIKNQQVEVAITKGLFAEETKISPFILWTQFLFTGTPIHDFMFNVLIMYSLITVPLKLDNLIFMPWMAILIPAIVAFFMMTKRVLCLYIFQLGNFDGYYLIPSGTIFMLYARTHNSQIRYIISLGFITISLIFFLVHLEVGEKRFPQWTGLLPLFFVSLILIETSFRCPELRGRCGSARIAKRFLLGHAGGGVFCSLVLLLVAWIMGKFIGWYIVFTPLFAYYCYSLRYLFYPILNDPQYFIQYDSARYEIFSKITWLQGNFSMIAFTVLLLVTLDIPSTGMKFVYAFLPLQIWCLTNFILLPLLFGSEWLVTKKNKLEGAGIQRVKEKHVTAITDLEGDKIEEEEDTAKADLGMTKLKERQNLESGEKNKGQEENIQTIEV